MKINRLLTVTLIFVLALQIVGCAPSNEQIVQAIAKTQTAASYPTQTPYSTQTSYPTATYVPTITPEFRPLTWADLVDFILNDHTNWNLYSDEYNCVNFSLDLMVKAKGQNIDAWIVAVTFAEQPEGHTFVAFPTTDKEVIWIEPQSDDAYIVSQVAEYLCLANNPTICWSKGKITHIIQPRHFQVLFCDAR